MHPLIVKHVLLPAHEAVLGRGTFRYLRDLEQTQWWPADRLRELQQAKLRRLLRQAHTKCPLYRRRIDQAGIDPNGVTLDQLSTLPTLTKADIAADIRSLTDPTVPGGLHPFTTGGSTGAPLAFFMDRPRQAADQAARARSRRWFGIDLGQRELYVWGSPLELAAQDRLKTFRDRLTNQRLLNAFKMTPREMSRYLDELRRFDPVHLFGYPSSIARLVRHAGENQSRDHKGAVTPKLNGPAASRDHRSLTVAALTEPHGKSLRNPSLKAVFVTGELLLPSDRTLIEQAFGVPVADGYGSREGGFIAHQCPAGSYHITMESVIVELLAPDGRTAPPGSPGEITVTHLDAYGMPFIRYRTGDLARRSSGACPCGRGLECLEIVEGRRTDMLRTAGGGFAHALSVIYVLRDQPAVGEFKVVQRANLDLDAYIVARGEFTDASRRHACGLLQRQIGDGVDVRLHLVGHIDPDPSGKHRYVVSEA